jgi:hypothetical protein
MMPKWIILMTAVALIAGCAGSSQPFDYHDDRDEKPGPGLFSGEEGGFIIHGGPADKAPAAEKTSEKKDSQPKAPAP